MDPGLAIVAMHADDICVLPMQMIAQAIKEEILALTSGSAPPRGRCVSVEDGEVAQQAPTPALSMQEANGTGEHAAAALPAAAPQHSSQTHHKPASSYPRSVQDWAARSAAAGAHAQRSADLLLASANTADTVSDCGNGGSHMHVDSGVPSPRVNGGSDASMHSCCGSADEEEADSAAAAGQLAGRKRSSSKLNPPKEEDRTLPLKKLFENLGAMAGVAQSEYGLLSNGSSSSGFGAGIIAPKAASVAGDLLHVDEPSSARVATLRALHVLPHHDADSGHHHEQHARGLGLRDREVLARVLTGRSSRESLLAGASLSSAHAAQAAPESPFVAASPARPLSPAASEYSGQPLSPGSGQRSGARAPWHSSDNLPAAVGAPRGSGGVHSALLHNLSQVRLVLVSGLIRFLCNPSAGIAGSCNAPNHSY